MSPIPELSDSLLATICLLLLLVGLGAVIITLFILRSRRGRLPKGPPLRSQYLPGVANAPHTPQFPSQPPRQSVYPPTPAIAESKSDVVAGSGENFPPPGAMLTCPHCQHPIRSGARFCPKCGNPVIPASQLPLQSGPIRSSFPPSSQPPGMPPIKGLPSPQPRLCPNCQRTLRPGARFCPGCGKPVV